MRFERQLKLGATVIFFTTFAAVGTDYYISRRDTTGDLQAISDYDRFMISQIDGTPFYGDPHDAFLKFALNLYLLVGKDGKGQINLERSDKKGRSEEVTYKFGQLGTSLNDFQLLADIKNGSYPIVDTIFEIQRPFVDSEGKDNIALISQDTRFNPNGFMQLFYTMQVFKGNEYMYGLQVKQGQGNGIFVFDTKKDKWRGARLSDESIVKRAQEAQLLPASISQLVDSQFEQAKVALASGN